MITAVVVLCLLAAGYEYMFGWPDWLTPNGKMHRLPKF